MFRPRRARLKGLHVNRMIPNILTLLALCAGLTAIRFGLREQWEYAVLAVLVAAIFDGLDGRIARVLRGTSKFGAELDSLSDFVCFGVAPALINYLWALQGEVRFGWMLVLLFSVCCALRLARFNTAIEQPDMPAWAHNFFTGVPSPAGAGLSLMPMMASFQMGDDFFRSPFTVAAVMVVVSGLLVSRLPTYSFKKFKVPHAYMLPAMLTVGMVAAGMISAPWTTMSLIMLAYLGSLPFSYHTFRALKVEAEQLQARPGGEAPQAAGPPSNSAE